MVKRQLSPRMTVEQFDNGYWYAAELKRFAAELGIPSPSRLRKDQLEAAIKHFLRTGRIQATKAPAPKRSKTKDTEQGLHLELPITHYTNDKATKEFLLTEAKKMDPTFKLQSGTRYPLNRWREEQIASGRQITYGDLVAHFVELNKGPRKPLRIPHGRYNNFVADYMRANENADRDAMLAAWEELKRIDAPKTYEAWERHVKSQRS